MTRLPPAARNEGSASWVRASGATTFTSYTSRSAATG